MYKEAVLLPVAPSRSSRVVDVSQSEDSLEHGPIAPLAQLADDVKHLEIIIKLSSQVTQCGKYSC